VKLLPLRDYPGYIKIRQAPVTGLVRPCRGAARAASRRERRRWKARWPAENDRSLESRLKIGARLDAGRKAGVPRG